MLIRVYSTKPKSKNDYTTIGGAKEARFLRSMWFGGFRNDYLKAMPFTYTLFPANNSDVSQ